MLTFSLRRQTVTSACLDMCRMLAAHPSRPQCGWSRNSKVSGWNWRVLCSWWQLVIQTSRVVLLSTNWCHLMRRRNLSSQKLMVSLSIGLILYRICSFYKFLSWTLAVLYLSRLPKTVKVETRNQNNFYCHLRKVRFTQVIFTGEIAANCWWVFLAQSSRPMKQMVQFTRGRAWSQWLALAGDCYFAESTRWEFSQIKEAELREAF